MNYRFSGKKAKETQFKLLAAKQVIDNFLGFPEDGLPNP
jgi:hypothetical protein